MGSHFTMLADEEEFNANKEVFTEAENHGETLQVNQ